MEILKRFNNLVYNPITVSWLSDNEKYSIWKNYLFNHSGIKEESSLLEHYIFEDDTPKLSELTNIIEVNFKDKWERLHDALNLDYDVIDNYNRIEDTEVITSGTNNTTSNSNNTDVMTGGHSSNNSDVMTGGHSSNNSDVMTGGHSTIKTENNTHQVSAYNDDNFVNDNKDVNSLDDDFTYNNETKTSEDSFTYNNETKTSTDSFTYNNETKTFTGENTTENDTTGSSTTHSVIKGNIGVTTSQQMITSEFELRKYNIIDIIYKDLDSILTCAVYV